VSEADQSSLSSAEVKNASTYASTLPRVFMAWCLIKHGDNFILHIVTIQSHLVYRLIICADETESLNESGKNRSFRS